MILVIETNFIIKKTALASLCVAQNVLTYISRSQKQILISVKTLGVSEINLYALEKTTSTV